MTSGWHPATGGNVNKILLGVVLAVGLHAGAVAAATVPCSGLPGSLSDPAGDALFFGGPTPSPDIVCAGAQVSGGNLLLRVGFAPGTFDPATTRIAFNLDIDQNPATGFSGITSGHADNAVMGVEYLVEFARTTTSASRGSRPSPASACWAPDLSSFSTMAWWPPFC
jgi:hypothetical protein